MGHSVQLIIGRGEALERFLAAWPGSHAVQLTGGWRAIPVDPALFEAIQSTATSDRRDPAFDVSPPGLEPALASATRAGGALAYVETEYFGGHGSQSGGAWIEGRASEAVKSRGIGAINSALRAIGVMRVGADDEFDSIGLGERRTMSDYEPEGIVRHRAPPAEEATAPAPAGGYLPLWLVLLIAVAFVAIGLAVSVMGH